VQKSLWYICNTFMMCYIYLPPWPRFSC